LLNFLQENILLSVSHYKRYYVAVPEEMLYNAYWNICLSIIYILWQKCPHLSANPCKVEPKPPTKNLQACKDTCMTHTEYEWNNTQSGTKALVTILLMMGTFIRTCHTLQFWF